MFRDKRQIKKQFIKELKRLFKSELYNKGPEKINRIEIPISEIDLFDWLYRQGDPAKIYWSGRDHDFAIAGIGLAKEFKAENETEFSHLFAKIKNNLEISSSKIKFYGGFKFDPQQAPAPEWNLFANAGFFVPRFEIYKTKTEIIFAYNFVVPGNEKQVFGNFEKSFDQLVFSKNTDKDEICCYTSREDIPKWNQWEKNINHALNLFEKEKLEKVVLAKQSRLTFESHVNPILLLKKLAPVNPSSYHFCFQLAAGAAFVGITPERLYHRNNGDIYSEALAGTRPRHEDEIVDKQLGKDLLHSEKDLREHRSVSNMVKNSLEPFCDQVEIISSESLVKLAHVQHLHTLFRGHLSNGVTDKELIDRLHPTPAVGGFPRKKALKQIAKMEPFDRGWYAGPVGWISNSASEFAVAIRSALVADKTVSLYAGSGIVKGSDPQKEWEETENKILNFTRLFKHQ